MICIDAEQLQDGLYNIKDGKIYKYKAKGGTVRAYELRDIVTCGECKKSHIDGKTTHYLWCTEWGRSTDVFGYCERGEREGE